MNNTTWLITALLAPTLWGLTNVLDTALRKQFIKNDLTLTWISGLLRFPFVILFFWIGGFEFPSFLAVSMMFLAGIFWVLPIILYFKALEHEEPSRTALFLQGVPFFTLFLAYFLLDERLNFFQLIAFLFLIAGGLLAALKKIEHKWKLSKGLFLIGAACLMWSLSDVLFKKYEPAFSSFDAAFSVEFFSTFLLSLGLYFFSRRKKHDGSLPQKLPTRAWAMLIVSTMASNFGSLSFAYALTLKEASLTAVLMGVQPLAAFGLGFIFYKFIKEVEIEQLNKETLLIKGVALALILAGLILLQIHS